MMVKQLFINRGKGQVVGVMGRDTSLNPHLSFPLFDGGDYDD